MNSNPSARDVVYEFAEILGQLNSPILDERLLPHTKGFICAAFEEYLQDLKMRAQFDLDCQQELDRVQGLYVNVFDFQAIDPEDIALVSEINAGRRFERFRSRDGLAKGDGSPEDRKAMMEFAQMRSKYLNRTVQDAATPASPGKPANALPPLSPKRDAPKPPPRKLTAKQIWSYRPVKATLIAVAIYLVGPLARFGFQDSVGLILVALPIFIISGLFVASIFGAVMLIFKKPFVQSLATGYSIAVIGLAALALLGWL